MIFQHTWQKVLSGQKTETRRLVKPNQSLISIESAYGGYRPLHVSCNSHILYAVGKTYAVQPGRGQPAMIYNPDHPCYGIDIIEPGDNHYKRAKDGSWNYRGQGYLEARIQLLDIYPQDVRTISEASVTAEGFESTSAFLQTWTSMNDPHVKLLYTHFDGLWDMRLGKVEYWGNTDKDVVARLMLRPAACYQAFVYRFQLA